MDFGKLLGRPEGAALFPRQEKKLLLVEAVSRSSWGRNLKQLLSASEWDRVRKAAYKAARYRCMICGDRGPEWPVECHEEWAWDDLAGVQKLVRMIALCPACHAAKHRDAWRRRGNEAECREHIAQVNGWTPAQVSAHLAESKALADRRSKREWIVDASVLAAHGVDLEALAAHGPAEAEGYRGQEDDIEDEEREDPWDS